MFYSYYYWLIPSIFSFISSSLVFFHVIYLSRKSNQKQLTYLEWRTILYTLADIIQTSTWFLGNRKDHTGDICRVQEYLFEGATLSKVFLCVISSAIMSYAVSVRKLPDMKVIQSIEYFFLSLLILLMTLLIYYDGSRALCLLELDQNLQQSSRLVFLFAYMLPLGLTFFATIILTIPSLSWRKDIAKSVLKTILERLVSLPVIFSICFLPPLILSVIVVTTHHIPSTLYKLTAICVSLSGFIFAMFHFFYFKKIGQKRTITRFVSDVFDAQSSTRGPILTSSEYDPRVSYTTNSKFDESDYFGGD